MTRLPGLPLLLVAFALSACADDTSDAGLVAVAGDHTWTVEEAAGLLARQADLPAGRDVVQALADLWIDYTLLAAAAAADTTLAQVDVSNLVRDLVAEQLIRALRDSVIPLDTLTADEVRERYVLEAPGSLVRARQIVLTWPENATPAQRDSVRRAMDDLRRRIADGGEDFASLAEAYSQDPGSAALGGELPIFGRGHMVPALEEAAFSLEAGGLSQPVETSDGLHILMVEERPMPTVERFQFDLMAHRLAAAESTYVAALEGVARLEILDGAHERVRDMARDPRIPLGRREVSRPLVRYEGGSVTQSEVLWYLQNQDPEVRRRVASSRDDASPEGILRGVAHQELLVAAAARRGWSVPREAQNDVAESAHQNLAAAARQLGLMPIEPALDTVRGDAIEEAVTNLLSGILTGSQREVTPLGAMSYILRAQYPSRVVMTGLDEVLTRVEVIRAAETVPEGGDGR